MPASCAPPWHIRRNDSGGITWFRWLRPFGTSKIHYRIGPVPDDAQTTRIYDFGDGAPMTCHSCGLVIDGSTPTPTQPPTAFDGYPYLVTRIGHTPLRSIAILLADSTRSRLLDLARRQVAANQLEACLCIGPADAVYVSTSGAIWQDRHLPTGVPVVEGLALAEATPDTEDVRARRARLVAFREALNPTGYQVGDGLEGGRPATPEDIARLSVSIRDAFDKPIPAGLRRCRACRGLAGEFLATHGEGNGDMTPRVIRIHCRCENHNRCARCGRRLARDRLSSYSYDEVAEKAWYLAAYAALSHRCPNQRRTL